jgi:hypothetical protein
MKSWAMRAAKNGPQECLPDIKRGPFFRHQFNETLKRVRSRTNCIGQQNFES